MLMLQNGFDNVYTFESYKNMIQCIDQIQISISERFDHLTTLLVDAEQLAVIMKDEEKKRILVRNFRIIKSSEKIRVANEQKYLKQMEKCNKHLAKSEVIACENMFANCMNQYLNTDYEAKKSGDPADLIDIFIFYYRHINALTKINQLQVIKNCSLIHELNFMQENITFFLENVRASMTFVYEKQKERFLNMTKFEIRSVSPEKKQEEEQEKFDATGKISNKQKKKLQHYCFELSKLLDLESIYVNYFYFNSLDTEKRKRALAGNYTKRNVHIKRMIASYENEYRTYRDKCKK